MVEVEQAGSLLTEGQRFAVQDRRLDVADSGPRWLQQPRVAACVAEALLLGERVWKKYDLWASVIMANHVYVLLSPHLEMKQVTRAIKSYSARKANQILGRTGEPFWQDESYDHWIRKDEEFNRIIRYIEWNPVKASFGGASRGLALVEHISATPDLAGYQPAPPSYTRPVNVETLETACYA